MEPLPDLAFRSVVETHTRRPRFVRRDWLASDLDELLRDPECRIVLLTGAPGTGKSSFVAQLAQDHPDWPVYFNRRDQRAQLADGSARSVLLRVGLQLAASFPEMFTHDQVLLAVTQQVDELGTDAEVVAAEVDRIVASPFHQLALEITQTVARSAGDVVGLRAREWVVDPRLSDLADLAAMGLFNPALLLMHERPASRLVVLVDALDEVADDPSQSSFLDWLAGAPELPPNVRIVLTSRDEDRVRDRLGGHAAATRRLRIHRSDPRIQRELWELAEHLTRSPVVRDSLSVAGLAVQDLVTEAVTRADGNIGYLDSIFRAVDAATTDQTNAETVRALVTLQRLPGDLTELYAFFLRQIQTGPGRRDIRIEDPQTGRAAIVNVWTELMRPALAVLSVAYEPLSAELIAALTGTLADLPTVRDTLRQLGQFLDRTSAGWQLYHATVAEFVVSAELRADPSSADLAVDARETHAAIANRLGRDLTDLWEPGRDAVEDARRRYARSHYPRHLFDAGADEALFELLDEGRYGAGKLAADRSGFLYSLDLDLGFAATVDEPASTRHLVRAWKYRTLSTILVSPTGEPPPLLYATLARLGRIDEAMPLVWAIQDPRQRATLLAEVAENSSADAAPAIWKDAVEATGLIGDDEARADALTDVLRRLRNAHQWTSFGVAVVTAAEALLPHFRQLPAWTAAVTAVAYTAQAAGDEESFARAVSDLESVTADLEADPEGNPDAPAELRLRTMELHLAARDHAAAARAVDPVHDYLSIVRTLHGVDWNGWRSRGFDQDISRIADLALDDDAIPAQLRSWVRAHVAHILMAYGDHDRVSPMVEATVAAASDLDIEKLLEIGRLLKPVDRQAVQQIADLMVTAPPARDAESVVAVKMGTVVAGEYDDPIYQVLSPQESTFDVKAVRRAGFLADIGFPDAVLRIANDLNHSARIEALYAAIVALCAEGRIIEALETVAALEEEERATSFSIRVLPEPVAFLSSVGLLDRARAVVAAAAAEIGDFERSRAVIATLDSRLAQCWATSQLAHHEARAGIYAAAADDIARVFALWRDNAILEHVGAAKRTVTQILETGRAWLSPHFADGATRWFPDQDDRANLVETLLHKGQIELARAEIAGIEGLDRARLLVELSRHTGVDEARAILVEAESTARTQSRWFPGVRLMRRIAACWSEHGLPNDSARCLRAAESMAADLHTTVPGYPDERARMCGEWVDAGSIDEALGLLERIPPDDAFSRVFAQCAISRAAARSGVAFDVVALLSSAEGQLPEVAPKLRRAAASRLAVEWARHGELDHALALARPDIQAVALLLADMGQPERAAELFPELLAMPDDLISILIDQALDVGDVRRAVDLAHTRSVPAKLLARIARRGRAESLVQPVLDMLPYVTDHRELIMTDLGWAIAGIDGPDALLSLVHDAWANSATPEATVDALPFAVALFHDERELAIELADSLPWLLRSVPMI